MEDEKSERPRGVIVRAYCKDADGNEVPMFDESAVTLVLSKTVEPEVVVVDVVWGVDE